MTPPTVSILVLTYNHERSIARCLDGILEQKTEYNFEVHVAEDNSTDGTRAIVKEYQERFPKHIRAHFNPKNIGGKRNLITGYARMKGKYVTQLDGDDYWNHPEKLQRQVSFLEANPPYVGCAHNTYVLNEIENQPPEPMLPPGLKDSHTIVDLIDGTSYFHTSSVLTRNVFEGRLPDSQGHPLSGDWFLSLLYAEHGPFRYFDEVMSTYRIHSQGEWSQMSRLKRRIRHLDSMAAYHRLLGYRYPQFAARIDSASSQCLEEEKNLSFLTRLKVRLLRKAVRTPNFGSRPIPKYHRLYRLVNLTT